MCEKHAPADARTRPREHPKATKNNPKIESNFDGRSSTHFQPFRLPKRPLSFTSFPQVLSWEIPISQHHALVATSGLIIIVVSILSLANIPGMESLRALRALRPLRSIRSFPELRRTVVAFLKAGPALSSVVGLTIFFFLVFGIVGVELYEGALHHRCAA